ncbi:MAG TPA: deoxyribonuclease IV [Coriobacteriia bacterium]|nr:deoxyribonuclease IV [Coriobacteriia bacterium]
MLIGAHVSVAGGYQNGLEYGASVGAECIQFFAKSPRQWKGPAINPAASLAFAEQRERMNLGPAFTHTAYLLNLSTVDELLLEKTVLALADELTRAGLLGVDGVVTHVGTDPAGDESAAAMRAAAVIRAAYVLAGDVAANTRLLLENTAGGGSTFGCTFSQLASVVTCCGMPSTQLGICLDTCHAFAYGMPLDSAEGWRGVLHEIDSTVGLQRLGLIHANDCMFARGSRRDRHAWIGDGFIGNEGFSAMVCAPELIGVPCVVEMPGEKPHKDIVNLDRLKSLRNECAQSH